jgi:hypothetical protein
MFGTKLFSVATMAAALIAAPTVVTAARAYADCGEAGPTVPI